MAQKDRFYSPGVVGKLCRQTEQRRLRVTRNLSIPRFCLDRDCRETEMIAHAATRLTRSAIIDFKKLDLKTGLICLRNGSILTMIYAR